MKLNRENTASAVFFIKKPLIFPKFLGKNIIKYLGHLKMPVSVVAFVAFFISI